MTTDNASTDLQETAENTHPLLTWWQTVSFDGKPFCDFNEQTNELFLKAINQYPQRVLATLSIHTADQTIKALVEKHNEVLATVHTLNEEWQAATDKIKLTGKVNRTKEYLLKAMSIGDYKPILESVDEKEKVLQQLLDEHYQSRLQLVEHAEKLANTTEDWKNATQLLKDYEEQWRKTGYVDKSRNDALWERFEKAKEIFQERKTAHYEDQGKEMLLNLDLKLELVEKAEALKESEEWKETTEAYKQLMDAWKGVGRTMHEKNEELWERFIAAKNFFHDRKKANHEQIQLEQEENYTLKLALLEKAEQMKDSEAWKKTAAAYNELMEEWKKIGKVPYEKADELWNRLCAAKDHFFAGKRQHDENVKVMLSDNYAKKQAIVKRADEIKNSSQWKTATEEMNELMDEWKKIGPIPREFSNSLWEGFLSARKHFFARKDADREKRKEQHKQYEEKRKEQQKLFYRRLDEELKEEIEKLADFKVALENITPGEHKAEDLRKHLTALITQTEQRITQKQQKIESLSKEPNEDASHDEHNDNA